MNSSEARDAACRSWRRRCRGNGGGAAATAAAILGVDSLRA